jgi:hypothetical protein
VGTTRLRWELHGELHEYTFYDTECDAKEPFAPNRADRCLEQLLKHEEGQLIAALRLTVLAADGYEDGNALAARVFDGDELVAASVCDQRADMYSDFRLDATGCGRFLLIDRESRPPQLGRVVQRIIDMEVYRMMAMLAYPEARELARSLRVMEPRLSGLVTRLDLATTSEEPEILQDLTQLSAEVEQLSTYSAYRLDAARAYRGLVRQSLSDLRQVRLGWHQTPSEFLERRFDPVMNFCEAVNVRLESVSARVSRASGLLGGYADGVGTAALFAGPCNAAFSAPLAAIFIADGANHRIRRIALAPLILFGSTFLVYNLAAYANDPLAELRLSTDDGARQQIISLTRDLNLDVPAPLRYFIWLKGVLGIFVGKFDLGVTRSSSTVWDELSYAIPVSLRLVLVATVTELVIGIALGIISALRQYSRFDYAMTFLAFLLFSLTIFWVAVIMK